VGSGIATIPAERYHVTEMRKMTPKELLAQKPTQKVTDKYSGAVFEVRELAPILVAMMQNTPNDADEFADRFEALTDGN